MSASLAGSGTASLALRTNASRVGPGDSPASTGFHRVAGATSGSSAIFRGPTRRSSSGAIDRRQLAAASSRSAALIVTCASLSASANVDAATGGPDAGAVPNVGGAPGVVCGVEPIAGCCPPPHATAAPRTPSGAVIRNCLRVFMAMSEPGKHRRSLPRRTRPPAPKTARRGRRQRVHHEAPKTNGDARRTGRAALRAGRVERAPGSRTRVDR